MGNYYFLAASLPPLNLGVQPDIAFEELLNRLKINLNKEDYEKSVVLRRYFDLVNIRALLLQEEIDPRGNLNEKELDEALLIKSLLPDYVFDFLDQYETSRERIAHFPELIARFFSEEIPKQKGFLKRFLTFEREWRLVLIGLQAKMAGRDIAKELQFEDFSDPLVAHLLAQKDAESYEPPVEYRELKEKLQTAGNDPWEYYRVLAEFRFNRIEELAGNVLFSIDWILGYMARLIIVEHWNELDEERGKTMLQTLNAQ